MRRFKEFFKDGEKHYQIMFLSAKESTDKERAKRKEGLDEVKGWASVLSRTELGVKLPTGKGKKKKEVWPDRLKAHVLNTDHYHRETGGKYTDDELHAIEKYTQEGHSELNSNLFQGKPHTEEDDKHTDKHLSSAISKRTMPKNMTLYSGMRSPEKLPTHKDHILLHNPAYTSTSTSPEQAGAFGSRKTHDGGRTDHAYHQYTQEKYNKRKHKEYREEDPGDANVRIIRHKEDDSKGSFIGYSHIASIHVPKGSHSMFPGGHSNNSGEDEVILHKNAKIAFHKTPTVDHQTRTVMWKGKLVHDGIKPTRHGKALGLQEKK